MARGFPIYRAIGKAARNGQDRSLQTNRQVTIILLGLSTVCGFSPPLFWGKLSPQVTDEGVLAGGFPLIRRVPRHLPPKGKALARHTVFQL